MALQDHMSAASRNLALDSSLDVLNSGYIRIYSGTQPADVGTALSGNTLLAELRFGSTAFAAATDGSKTANAITSDSSADATGTATFYRCFKSDGTTAVLDGSVGTSSANLILNTTSIQVGATVAISSFVATMAA